MGKNRKKKENAITVSVNKVKKVFFRFNSMENNREIFVDYLYRHFL